MGADDITMERTMPSSLESERAGGEVFALGGSRSMKPIPTYWAGRYFRSRLETRWAVFFDTLRIAYEYEKESYDLGNGLHYLPDFWLAELKFWVEIKSAGPIPEEFEKARRSTWPSSKRTSRTKTTSGPAARAAASPGFRRAKR